MKDPKDMTAVEVLDAMNEIMDLGDMIYDVRTAAVEAQRWGPWRGESWDHPMVVRWGALCSRAGQLVGEAGHKEAGEPGHD
jgi:hypothetical protein